MKALHTAVASATLDLEMSTPERMGDDGGSGTNPEQLFAAVEVDIEVTSGS